MKVLVCGGRDYRDTKGMDTVLSAFHKVTPISTLIHGDSNGADTMAGCWAEKNGIQVTAYPADWSRHGRAAGPRRNEKMLHEGKPDKVIAFPGGRGTAHMVRISREAGVQVITVNGSSSDILNSPQ